MSSTAPARIALGNYGESVAERYLVEAGMTVLDRNWRCGQGEIDLILRDADTFVVCEVKTRSSTAFGSPRSHQETVAVPAPKDTRRTAFSRAIPAPSLKLSLPQSGGMR